MSKTKRYIKIDPELIDRNPTCHILAKYDWEGYGRYIGLLSYMVKYNEPSINLDDLSVYSHCLDIPKNELKELLDHLSTNPEYRLFFFDGYTYTSYLLCEQLAAIEAKSQAARDKVNKRWRKERELIANEGVVELVEVSGTLRIVRKKRG